MKKILQILGLFLLIAVTAGCSRAPVTQEEQSLEKTQNELNSNKLSEEIKTSKEDNNDLQNIPNNKQATSMEEKQATSPESKIDLSYSDKYSSAILKTNLGDIAVEFFADESPITVNNFLKLAEEKFYNGTTFHRVIKDFMIQGGDPLSKDGDPTNDGTGDPGYKFQDEINSHKIVSGSLAMANSGPNTNGSQFFIVTADATPWLDGKHTNFGKVTKGMDIVDKIENVKIGINDRPVENVVIESIELIN